MNSIGNKYSFDERF